MTSLLIRTTIALLILGTGPLIAIAAHNPRFVDAYRRLRDRIRGPFAAPSPAHPAASAVPTGNGRPLDERELRIYTELMATEFPQKAPGRQS